ncbi:MAG: DUF4268 domain-containing protein, partial [Anaerolineae bacterium]|nr:DUF4268 domain-containing protein [Anaerolineae bacterium]
VVLLSPDARKSQWVVNELSFASAHGVSIFPVLVRGEEKDSVPLQLANTQRVDLRQRFLVGMQSLIDAVREHLAKLGGGDESPVDETAWMDRRRQYVQFWKLLQERSQGRTDLFTNLSSLDTYFLSTSAGRKGVKLGYLIALQWGTVNVYIDIGDKARNKAFFDALYAQREAIEAEMNETLDWRRLDNKRACQFGRKFEDGGLENRDSWPKLIDRMIDSMIRLDKAVRPRLNGIDL